MTRKIFLKNNIYIIGAVCLFALVSLTLWLFLYLSDAFKRDPSVTIYPNNCYERTLNVVTDIDYEPFSYIGKNGEYMGMDVELIAEIANRLKMNLNLKLMDWTEANELFLSGGAEAFLNMEADSIANDINMLATLPTVEKQYVVYGQENISSVPELYGRRVASLHRLPELGLGNGITYIDSYAEIFESLKNKEFEFAICPIQVGNVFLDKLKITDIKPSYAVGHIYGAIALKAGNNELKERIDAIISQLQKEGILSELEHKWVSHRYQSMTLMGMIESHPEVLLIFFVTLLFIVFLLIYLVQQDKHSKELIIAKDKAEESSRAKSEFLANMSHEIRTPINAVLGMNEMIIRESKDDNVITYARNVESAGKNLLSIINDILDFSKIEAGKMNITEANYELSSVLDNVSNMIKFKAEQKNLDFVIQVDENLPDELFGDEVRVRQVITNVLNNAVKYTNEGHVLLDVRGEIQNKILNLKFIVSDTGIGIKSEDLPKLFGKFQRVDLVQNNTIEGTGLGLSITKNLLKLMNGDISVESEYGKGSTFTILIPQKIISDKPIGNFHEKFSQHVKQMKTYHESFKAPDARILIVDDTEMNLTVLEGLLSRTEIKIDTALSGMKALELTEKVNYDLIFMDQRMPQMDGTQTLNNIRSQKDGQNTKTPVICLTANVLSGARAKYIEEGFTDYLSKPVEGSEIEATLMKYLPETKVIPQDFSQTQQENATESELRKFYDSVESLNYDNAIKFCSNEDILFKTLEQFYLSIKDNANEIESYFANKDYKNYTIKVHALKSSARLVGAAGLSEMAAKLEDCGNDLSEHAINEIEEFTPILLKNYRSYHEILAQLYEDENDSKPEISLEELHEAYEAIQELAEFFDIDSIDEIISKVRKYKIPASESEKFSLIESCTRNMDWNGLEKALRS